MTLRVLLVEDSPSDAKLVLLALRQAGREGIEHTRVQDRNALVAALDAAPWDVIISDWSMPSFSALAALEVVKSRGLDVPFIIVSGTVGEEVAVDAMRAGASDYVLKDRLTRLPSVIERELREHRLREDHRQSEQARRRSETRFARLYECGLIGIAISDRTGRFVESNSAFLQMVGFSQADVATTLRWDTLTNDAAILAAELAERGVVTPRAVALGCKDGSRITVLLGIANADTEHAIAFMVDLTAQQRAEDALQKSEAQLRQAQKMEAVGRLAGGIAHDFNNLLTVILSHTELMTDDLRDGDPMREDLEQINKAGRRAAGLTRQLLTFSRQEILDPKVLAIDTVLVGLQPMLQRILGEDVELTVTCNAANVRVDEHNLEQVIMNLVVNARDAMPTGGKLRIETQNLSLDDAMASCVDQLAAGRYVLLSVSDTGMGMDSATQARIFEPFFTTKPVGQGTGLGLSTVFGIVRQCGGGLRVESDVGRGTTFRIYLPRIDAAAEVATSTTAPRMGGTETILLVEDEQQIRSVLLAILQKLGYDVIEASDGNDALRKCADHSGSIDLLLTDVVMPRMSGPVLAKKILERSPATRVVCMSGYTDDALIRHGAVGLGIAYLAKPITPDKLARKVREVLDMQPRPVSAL